VNRSKFGVVALPWAISVIRFGVSGLDMGAFVGPETCRMGRKKRGKGEDRVVSVVHRGAAQVDLRGHHASCCSTGG
jgi:hypothetical protein